MRLVSLASRMVASACGLVVAIRNGPDHFVLGGPEAGLVRAAGLAEGQGAVRVVRLGVTTPSHTPWLAEASRVFAERLQPFSAGRLAFPVLSAIDGRAARQGAEATAALGKIPPDQFIADLRSGLDELQRRAPGMKLAVLGFCFGGGLTWQLLAAGEPRLAAALPFYGPLPDPHDFAGSKQATVLAFYGAKDERVTSTKDAAATALEQAGVVHQIVVEPDADHAFFNDTGPRYNEKAAADAWQQTQSWLARYLA